MKVFWCLVFLETGDSGDARRVTFVPFERGAVESGHTDFNFAEEPAMHFTGLGLGPLAKSCGSLRSYL